MNRRALQVAMVALMAACPTLALATPTVVAGTDYMRVMPGSSIDLGGSIGSVALQGKPIGPGWTDTTIRRLASAAINGAAVAIQVTALSLQSVAPVTIGAASYNVFVTLDPAHLADDAGTLVLLATGLFGLALRRRRGARA